MKTVARAAGRHDDVTDPDDFDDDYNFGYDGKFIPADSTWPTRSGITLQQAERLCHDSLYETSIAKGCIRAGVMSGIGDDAVRVCVEDIKLMDSTEWVDESIAVLLDDCERNALKSPDLWQPVMIGDQGISPVVRGRMNSQMEPQPFLQDFLCPKNCSNRGQCKGGICQCSDGYTAFDCSVTVNGVPRALGFLNRGLCDRRKKPCRRAYVLGKGFLDTNGLRCIITDQVGCVH